MPIKILKNTAKNVVLVLVTSSIVALGACGQGGMNKATMGTLGGAVLGGVAGSAIGGGRGRMVAIGLGATLGALAGHSIGQQLDEADKQYQSKAYSTALEYNRSGIRGTWYNPDSGHSGYIMPQRTFQGSQGEYCREFTQTVKVGSKLAEAYGTACRMPDGTWKLRQ